jgi:fluoride exporter
VIIFFIALGGALGSIARYLTSEFIISFVKVRNSASTNFLQKTPLLFTPSFPWSTFLVNVIGSMLAGIIYYFLIRNFNGFDERLKNFLLAGFLGGFTTFSTFSLDFFRLFAASQYLQALIYMAASVIFSILLLFVGFYLTKVIFS